MGGEAAAAAAAALAGSVAGQGVAMAMGLQSKFDWSGVALAALSGITVTVYEIFYLSAEPGVSGA
jgi:hypothetical protein